jgi:proline iminopeptidase
MMSDQGACTHTQTRNTLEPWDVIGNTQWVLRRSAGRRETAILWLHGGPGSTLMPFSHAFDAPLLERFDVVHWDQRGSGKSYDPRHAADPLELGAFVSDLHAVSRRLRTEGEYEKIVCIGHSWGSIVGLETAARFPDAMDAFVGVGQVVDDAAAQRLGRSFCHDAARRNRDADVIRALDCLGEGPLLGEQRLTLSSLVARCGGIFGSLLPERLGALYATSPFTFPQEEENQGASVARLVDALWPSVLAFDFMRTLTGVRCPVLFLQGARDVATPAALLTNTLGTIPAEARPPYEILAGCGHFPFWEDPAGFARRVVAFMAT